MKAVKKGDQLIIVGQRGGWSQREYFVTDGTVVSSGVRARVVYRPPGETGHTAWFDPLSLGHDLEPPKNSGVYGRKYVRAYRCRAEMWSAEKAEILLQRIGKFVSALKESHGLTLAQVSNACASLGISTSIDDIGLPR